MFTSEEQDSQEVSWDGCRLATTQYQLGREKCLKAFVCHILIQMSCFYSHGRARARGRARASTVGFVWTADSQRELLLHVCMPHHWARTDALHSGNGGCMAWHGTGDQSRWCGGSLVVLTRRRRHRQ